MANLRIDTGKIIDNIKKLNDHLEPRGMTWTLVAKVLCGHKETLEKILSSDEIFRVDSIGDSRLSNLATVKEINPKLETMYIKPPAIQNVEDVIKYADVSYNTSIDTIKALNEEAKRQGKIHKVLIMIEMGELREGVLHENILEFYSDAFELDNIIIEGIGTNLGCMYGIEPTYDKLIQLSLYKQLLEAKFDRDIKLVSGGTSITLPLIEEGKIPAGVNHFRIGEAAFLGLTPLTNEKFRDLHTDAFEYTGNIVEIEEKNYIPEGKIGDGSVGHLGEAEEHSIEDKSYKAILDFGILDVDMDSLDLEDEEIDFIGTTSDLTVFDLHDNKNPDGSLKYRVGDEITFYPIYMGVARLMNSSYIDKEII